METQVNGPAEKTPEQIEREMLATRESLTEKVAALEQQVVGTVQNAADTLSGTVDKVKEFVATAPGAVSETVKQAAEAVSESVRKTFDISGHVQHHPWAAMSVSTGLGFLVGWFTASGRESLGYSRNVAPPPAPGLPTPTRLDAVPTAPTAHHSEAAAQTGLWGGLANLVGQKLRGVVEQVIESASAAVQQSVEKGIPKLVNAAAEHLTPPATDNGRFDRPAHSPM